MSEKFSFLGMMYWQIYNFFAMISKCPDIFLWPIGYFCDRLVNLMEPWTRFRDIFSQPIEDFAIFLCNWLTIFVIYFHATEERIWLFSWNQETNSAIFSNERQNWYFFFQSTCTSQLVLQDRLTNFVYISVANWQIMDYFHCKNDEIVIFSYDWMVKFMIFFTMND